MSPPVGCLHRPSLFTVLLQVGWPCQTVGSHLELACICQINPVNSQNDSSHDDSTINIVLCIIIIIVIIIYYYYYYYYSA